MDRIEKRLRALNIHAPEFQRRLGIKSQDWNNWKNRGVPGGWWERIAFELGCAMDDLFSSGKYPLIRNRGLSIGTHDANVSEANHNQVIEWETPEDLPEGVYALVPRVRLSLSAGNGRFITEEELGAPLAFTAKWIRDRRLQKKDLICVDAIGDSMEPRIHDGDLLLINTGDKEATDGNIYAIRYGDDLRVKRLFRRFDGSIIIRSDNREKYVDEVITPSDLNEHVSIIGRVVWVSGNV